MRQEFPMKKIRFLSLILTVSILFSLCVSSAGAFDSEIVSSKTVQAKAAILVDMDTDYVMYDLNAHEKMYPASITKVMTAALTLDAVSEGKLSLDKIITAGPTAWQGLDTSSSNQNIQVGEQMSVKDLLYCLMVASANEAANILAVAVAGNIDNFVAMMNAKAASWAAPALILSILTACRTTITTPPPMTSTLSANTPCRTKPSAPSSKRRNTMWNPPI